ncbi:PAQR family membrane homeostasis protein TrhA [Anaeromyxobacter oryzae]|uniref:Membrane protein n=1 Tax=Anaeromyxobacter oryzae TaxID=2918170 RepID=A0ABM7WR64_9BACT|nr:hemolysin III family protein [Anaeromyxobacter oryzae]BDG01957.1 membrane protein [Anaeromyxobacter oryzae]
MHAATETITPPKPLLRGVSHEIAAGVALAAGVGLVLSATSPRGRVAALVYGASLFTLFAVSALYHRPTWSPRARLAMRRLDHSAIFVLIAGTYTPLCLLLGGARGATMLAIAWGGALLGVGRAVLWPTAPKALAAAIYVALGWVVLPVLPALRALLGAGDLAVLAAGGIVYSLGAVVYASRRPDPFPRVFGYHEVFHAMVIVAAALHFVVGARAVLALG